MISRHSIHRLFLVVSMMVALSLTTVTFGVSESWASTGLNLALYSPRSQLIAMNRVESMGKSIEGKTQEMIGNITGDSKDKMIGKAKQIESQTQNLTEDMKDKVKRQGRAKAITKNIGGRIQESKGKVSGNRKDQMVGKGKQLESQVRNTLEDVKGATERALK